MTQYRLYLAGVLAGTLAADYRAKGTDLCARAALSALGLIDMRNVIVIKGNRSEFAHVITTVGKAAAAGAGYLMATNGTLVTSNFYYLYNIGIGFVATNCKLYPLAEDGSFLVHTAAHRWLIAGNYHFGNIDNILKKLVFPRKAGYLAQHLIFQMLYLGIKFSHKLLPSKTHAANYRLQSLGRFVHFSNFIVRQLLCQYASDSG